ncbi:unnamed protein product [Symbiodinium sp. CCMP2592]|nr:unnamed protein product [Symbiodinium sp. CCMP2592]
MCKWYCTSSGPSTNLCCLHCGAHYCGACLRGDAGKMESLVKCAGCGKKPGVKSNTNRNSWTAVCNAPCNERGGPRYDEDDGAANSAFTSGLRACGAQETDAAAQRRTSRGASVGAGRPGRVAAGPERFFYDKSTYTGTHTNGGPEHVAKGLGSHGDRSWKRPSMDAAEDMGHLARVTLLSQQGGRPPSPLQIIESSLAQKGATPRPSTVAHPVRPASRGRPGSRGPGAGRLVGPERFFYDRSTYTGTHTRGGPSSVAKGGGTSFDQTWKRPV